MASGRKEHLEELAAFIREHRNNEANFETIYARLEKESGSGQGGEDYQSALAAIKDKQGETYRNMKEKTGSAWPEFENFVNQFEQQVMEVLREA